MAGAIKWEAILDPRSYLRGAGRVERRTKQMGSVFGGLGTLAKRVAGPAALGALVLGAGRLEKEWGDATDRIRTGTGKTGKALGGLVKDFNAVATSAPASLDDVGVAISKLNARTGQTGKGLQDLARRELALARITKTDLGENIAATTRLFGDWGIKTDQQAGTLDKLFRASQATGASVTDLATQVVQFGSPLRQLGFDLDTTVALFGEFEKTGVNIQTALPGLRMALKNFAAAGREPAPALMETIKAIKEAGSTAEANKLAFKTFGVRAGPDLAAAIREGHFDLDKLIRLIDGGGDTILGAAKDTEGFTEAWKKFTNFLKITAGPIITRVFDAAGRKIGQLTRWFRDDLAPQLGRVQFAWDQNKDAILGFLAAFVGADSSMTSGKDAAVGFADALERLTETAGDVAEKGKAADSWFDQFRDRVKGVGEGANRLHGEIQSQLPTWARWTVSFRDHIPATQGVADATDLAAEAATRHATALRDEKTALDAIKGVMQGEKAAELDLRQAKLNVQTAQSRLNDVKAAGKTRSVDYRQAQIDLSRAQLDLQRKTDAYKAAQQKANATTSGAAAVTGRTTPVIQRLGLAAQTGGQRAGAARVPWRKLGEDAAGAMAKIKSKQARITANFGWQGLEVFRVGPKGRTRMAFAAGGRLDRGFVGGPTEDANLIRVSKGETVVSAADSSRPDFMAWARERRIPGFAQGGTIPKFGMTGSRGFVRALGSWERRISKILDFGARAFGNTVKAIGGNPAIKRFILSTDPLPYRWGAAGPGAYDCSGLVGAVYGKLTGRGGGHGQRYFTTATIGTGVPGLRPGLGGVLQIGVTPGRGHMAGRYGGLGFEAESTRSGIKVGSAASRPESFARHYSMARGGRVDARLLAALARLRGVDIGGDFGRIRINGRIFDSGGSLPPHSATLAINRTSRSEPVGLDVDALAKAIARELAKVIPTTVLVDDIHTGLRNLRVGRRRPLGYG